MKQKEVFKRILAVTSIILALLPLLVTMASVLTGIFNRMGWYVWLQEVVVPFESRLVALLIKLVGIEGMITPNNQHFAMVLLKPGNVLLPVQLEWNCLGWQSLLILSLTLVTGLQGPYTKFSKIQVILFGLLGTFLTNIIRMALITSLAFYWNSFAAMIIHDYFAMFVALGWMIFFWWFSYAYILEERL